MEDLWKIAISLTGISGIGAFVFLSLYKEWIIAPALSGLTKVQKYNLLRLFLVLTFLFAIATLMSAAYQKQQEGTAIQRSKEEFYRTQQAKYELGRRLLQEKLSDPLLSDAQRAEVRKLSETYNANVDEAAKALDKAQFNLWLERTKQVHELLQSDLAKKYLPEQVKTWEIAREPPINFNMPS